MKTETGIWTARAVEEGDIMRGRKLLGRSFLPRTPFFKNFIMIGLV
jgi:hypothetical protein